MFDDQTQLRLFCKKLPIYKLFCRISNAIFDNNLQSILQSHPFLMSQSFETQGWQWYGVKGIKSTGLAKKKLHPWTKCHNFFLE